MTNPDQSRELLTRREAVQRVSALFGGMALVGQAALLTACSDTDRESALPTMGSSADNGIALLDDVAETILPETETPGAKAAGVGAFMALMVADTYTEAEREIFNDGLATIDARCRESFGHDFVAATADERLTILQPLDTEQFEYMREKPQDAPAHFFRMMKELALLGYFTSEIGYTQAMRYTETPGRYDPCVPFAPGEKAWAPHA